MRLTALNTLVSFKRKITLATRGGTLMDTAWGRTTSRRAWVRVMPRLRALSIWMGATASRPLRKASAM